MSETIQRETYQWPENFPDDYQDASKFTRFGYSPKYPVVGIGKHSIRRPFIKDVRTK